MTVGPDRSRIQAIKFGALNLGALNQRTVRAAFAFLASVLHFFIKTEVALGKTCESAFVTAAFTQPSSKSTQPASPYQLHLEQQVHQFNQLLIDSQSEKLSPIERQSRLADAQRIFIELTEAHPEIAELIQDEWRKLHSTSEHAVEAKRQRIISEIQALKHQSLTLKSESKQVGDWEIVKDSANDPKVKAKLASLLRSQANLNNTGAPLQISDERYIRVSRKGGPGELDARRPGGHTGAVGGAINLPEGKILSWSRESRLILWKLVNLEFVVDQIMGEDKNTDPQRGHTDWINGAQILADGRILSWSEDHTLILWKLVDDTYVVDKRLGKIKNTDPNKGHTHWVKGAQILLDGRILSWSVDHTLILWTLLDDKYVIVQRLGEDKNTDPQKGHTNWVKGAQILPDGRILSWSDDHTLIRWTLLNNKYVIDQRLGVLKNTDPSKGHIDRITGGRELIEDRIVSSDETDRHLLWRFTYPLAIQNEIDTLSRELNSLKATLTQLESQGASNDIDQTGGER